MKKIELTQGKVTMVDDDDFEWLSQWKWGVNTPGYAYRRAKVGESEYTTGQLIFMHRVLADALEGLDVDHINRNSLDNRRENLRVVTHAINLANSCSRKGTSIYKGVCWDSGRSRWSVKLRHNYQTINIGRFVNEIEAALAYDSKARVLWGEHGRYNFPLEGEQSALRKGNE